MKKFMVLTILTTALSVAASTYQPGAVLHIGTTQELDQIVNDNPLVIVDVFRQDCNPCRRMAPIIAELAQEYQERALFVKYEITSPHDSLISRLGISSVPTFLIYKDGKEVRRVTGYTPKKDFRSTIDGYL